MNKANKSFRRQNIKYTYIPQHVFFALKRKKQGGKRSQICIINQDYTNSRSDPQDSLLVLFGHHSDLARIDLLDDHGALVFLILFSLETLKDFNVSKHNKEVELYTHQT